MEAKSGKYSFKIMLPCFLTEQIPVIDIIVTGTGLAQRAIFLTTARRQVDNIKLHCRDCLDNHT